MATVIHPGGNCPSNNTINEALSHATSLDVNDTVSSSILISPTPQAYGPIVTLPADLAVSTTGLSTSDRDVLLRKREWLRSSRFAAAPGASGEVPNVSEGATLVFALSSAAAAAVCVFEEGLLLTCAHCVAEDASSLDWEKLHWLVWPDGDVVAARTVAWDGKRDLALLRVLKTTGMTPFPRLRASFSPPQAAGRVFCVGYPSGEDRDTSGAPVVSEGVYVGVEPGADAQDNAGGGALAHTCWTYRGRGGGPLVENTRRGPELVGLHAGWEGEDGGMGRRGIAWDAVLVFLEGWARTGNAGVAEEW